MNLLELQGRDRDRLIFLKRNTKFAPSRRQWREGRGFPYYSSNRNRGWELWDELPEPKRYYLHLNNVHEISYQNNENIEFIHAHGTSFGDAASKAWLRRYYNTQWLKK